MKSILFIVCLITTIMIISCTDQQGMTPAAASNIPLAGTWKLISGTIIEKGDTVITTFDKNVSIIKIINDSHFCFLQHDTLKGQDANPVFVAGGGRYTLKDSLYTEHLEYCSARNWENNDFTFVVNIHNDTLTQHGVEKMQIEGMDRINFEKYVRVK